MLELLTSMLEFLTSISSAEAKRAEKKMTTATKVLKKGAYHHGDLRQQLVNALRLLVEEEGTSTFSISEACRRAGVSSAAPYRHFGGREDMLRAVALDGKQRMAAGFRAATVDKPHGSLEAIKAIGVAYVTFAQSQPNVFRLMFSMDANEDEDLCAAGDACYEVALEHIGAFLGLDPKSEEANIAGFPLWAFVHGLAFLSIDGMLDDKGAMPFLESIIGSAGQRLLGQGSEKSPG